MLEAHLLTRYYDEFAALKDVSFSVKEGEILGLLGVNGAGKSTTLKILAGLLPPTSGTVVLDGHDLTASPFEVRARIGYLPEHPPLYEEMTVSDFLLHTGRLKGMSRADAHKRLPEVLAAADLVDRAHQRIGTLSHGYRKRVGIGQAIFHDPRLLILDEPISGLDPVQIVEIRQLIRRQAEGRAVLISSHILSEVQQTCDHLLVLRDGEVVARGTEAELTASMGRSAVHVTVRGDREALARWLNAHPQVVKWSWRDDATEGELSVLVTLSSDQRAELAAGLVAEGFALLELAASASALEQLFVGWAGGDA